MAKAVSLGAWAFAGAVALAAASGSPASAATVDVPIGVGAPADTIPLTYSQGWTGFFYGSTPGSSWFVTGAAAVEFVDFTFTLTSAADLDVTDLYLPGTQFQVSIDDLTTNTTVTRDTSAPGTGPSCFGVPATCFVDPDISHGQFLLGPGQYIVTGIANLTPNGAGQGALELVDATPIPTTWAMMLGGLLALGFGLYYRPKNSRSVVAGVTS
jgi:hypothetical protein